MGKRLRKKELALLSPGQMTKAGVTRGGWSVKDVLAHLVEWQQMNLDWYAAGLRGEKPAMPAPGFTLRELPRLNEMIYRKHHRRSVRAVMHDYRSYHERVVELIEALSDADLVTLRRFSWTGPSWTLSDYLRASTSGGGGAPKRKPSANQYHDCPPCGDDLHHSIDSLRGITEIDLKEAACVDD